MNKSLLVLILLLGFQPIYPLPSNFSQDHSAHSPSAEKLTIEGEVDYCFQGKFGHIKGIPVRIYTLSQSKDIRNILDRFHAVPNNNSASSLDQVFSLIDKFEDAVRHSTTFLPVVNTDSEGRFKFENVPAGQSYFVLVVNLEAEDGTDWVSQMITNLKPGTKPIKLIYWADSEEACKAQKK